MNFNEIRKQVSAFREKLLGYIEELPSKAEGVTFLDKEGKCGVVSFSTVAKNNGILCVDYYLNHTAKEALKHVITKTPLESLDKVIEKIIQTGRIPWKPIKINPQFINKLKQMWEDENDTKND